MLGQVDSNPRRPHHAIGSPAAFRPSPKQYVLHPLEKTLAGIVITLLIFLPWALGGMKLWAQWTAFALAALAFIVALIPRTYDDRYHAGGNLRLHMGRKLLHFPLFWLGVFYVILVVLQILNPAWTYRTSSAGWWLEGKDYITWLPHGIEGTPFAKMNGWRTLLIQGGAWLLVCALWVGLTRRRTLLIILVTLVINAVILGGVAAAQRLTNTNDILWFIPSPNEILGTFFYRNPGAAWFNLTVAAAAGLAAWFQLRALRSFAKSSPAAVVAFLALFLGVVVIISYSRGGVISLCVFLAAFLLAYVWRHLTLPAYPRRSIIMAILAVGFTGFIILGLRELNARQTWNRMEQLFEGNQTSILVRQTATQATLEMWQADPWLGHGAGGFRYLFPLYQQHHPLIYEYGRSRLFWEYTHNDPAQALAELGLLGVGLFAAGILWWLYALLRRGGHRNLMVLALVLGAAATVFHSWGEFVFHCPAILYYWAALFILALQWSEKDKASR
jgi:O-antigen ligase